MASQIQGLKKVAAANRNKTKSQLRESHDNRNPANMVAMVNKTVSSHSLISFQELLRQSANTAMGIHTQSSAPQPEGRSSSVARLHNHLNNGLQP